ncbi:hypothetical protein PanWU01x14_350590 [Parasponia andersonii]|uniref:Uncharacterized protein n=1 Tax=Parasponia andersonii TaxID=3476 RepID=A0A2P5AAW8_PARAD|nr:hypothetical protein PanWU01x14_350590 [Parasponia andersonii]
MQKHKIKRKDRLTSISILKYHDSEITESLDANYLSRNQKHYFCSIHLKNLKTKGIDSLIKKQKNYSLFRLRTTKLWLHSHTHSLMEKDNWEGVPELRRENGVPYNEKISCRGSFDTYQLLFESF